jgi:hypothetical protein
MDLVDLATALATIFAHILPIASDRSLKEARTSATPKLSNFSSGNTKQQQKSPRTHHMHICHNACHSNCPGIPYTVCLSICDLFIAKKKKNCQQKFDFSLFSFLEKLT